jgi:hypothetical protein
MDSRLTDNIHLIASEGVTTRRPTRRLFRILVLTCKFNLVKSRKVV